MEASIKHRRKKKQLGSYPYFTVVFSISISLFVIGLFALLYIHAEKLSQIIKENIEIHVFLDHELPASQIHALKKEIASQPYVSRKNRVAQISYISREEAAKKFIKETGEDFTKFLGENPLRASFVVKIAPQYAEADKMKEIASSLAGMTGVYEVDYVENLVEQINNNIKTISIILIAFAVILIITAVMLINNTIKLALYSQRFLIRSMQLVGGTSAFIQRPFLVRAAIQGFCSGIIASVMLAGLLKYAYTELPELKQLQQLETILIIFILIILLGVLIGLLSSYRAVKKYLNMSLDELY
ncbi:MAG TPA: permease-like cell division protein FtsX [Cytophagaceae bacterium]